MVIILIIIGVELAFIGYILFEALMRPLILQRRKMWQSVYENFKTLEKA